MMPRPKLAIKKAKEAELAAQRKALAEENKRIGVQRALFSALDPCPAKDRLLKTMEDRIIWLLDNCRHEEADALLEFVPEDAAAALLDEYFAD